MAGPKVVGITGTIGAGKSLIGSILAEHNQKVIDTDQTVHQLFADDPELQRAIGDRFPQAMEPNGEVNRAKLGAIVFDDAEARRDLEAIVHPPVVNAVNDELAKLADLPYVFILVPLLFEARLESRYDIIWTVTTEEPILIQRLMARSGLPETELRKRIAAQISQAEKAARSTRVIDNSGTVEQTRQQVERLLAELNGQH